MTATELMVSTDVPVHLENDVTRPPESPHALKLRFLPGPVV
jgi:hypothetical protein